METRKLRKMLFAFMAIIIIIISVYMEINYFPVRKFFVKYSDSFSEQYKNEIEERLDYPVDRLGVRAFFGLLEYTVAIAQTDFTDKNPTEFARHCVDVVKEYKSDKWRIRSIFFTCRLSFHDNTFVLFSTGDFVSVQVTLYEADMDAMKNVELMREEMDVDDFYSWLNDYTAAPAA